jgi:rubrerythrin
MIRQLSSGGLKFRTPRWELSVQSFSEDSRQHKEMRYVVTKESTLNLHDVKIGEPFSNVTVDVLGFVENIPFVIYVTYKDRAVPAELKPPTTPLCGVVELNVNAVPALFKQAQNGQYIEALRRYIEDQTEGKSWVYHPREKVLREEALANLRRWHTAHKSVASHSALNKHSNSAIYASGFDQPEPNQDHAPESVIQSYKCIVCKNTWSGTSRICENCKTHLYTTDRK